MSPLATRTSSWARRWPRNWVPTLFSSSWMSPRRTPAKRPSKQRSRSSRPCGVINCAGVGSAVTTIDKKLEAHSEKMWEFVVRINLYGTFFCSSEGAAAMAKLPADEEGNRGVIINVASVAAYEGQKGQLAYSASKNAVVGMTLPMARDLSRYGIRVMTIAPGIMATPLMDQLPAKVQEGLLASVAGPKRFGKSEEFAQLAASIIDNGYLNGETIRMDGGIRFANL
mmetsp:Transcript_35559/g.52993  ORF Transcript_35559/g.52993 Transcript_35559/m.52993 type:complete len:226 (-) Transcript_35559:324-1001(-)